MNEMISGYLHNNIEEILLLGTLVILVLTMISLHKIKKMSRAAASVIQSVEHYLSVIMDEEDALRDADADKAERAGKIAEISEKERRMEEENRLVSAVLQEIFP